MAGCYISILPKGKLGLILNSQQLKVMDVRFPIWKPAPGNDGPPRVRIQGSTPTLVGQMQFALLLLNVANQVIPTVLSN